MLRAPRNTFWWRGRGGFDRQELNLVKRFNTITNLKSGNNYTFYTFSGLQLFCNYHPSKSDTASQVRISLKTKKALKMCM